jgi:formylglycine-generating enzyme required for sulfatase activity
MKRTLMMLSLALAAFAIAYAATKFSFAPAAAPPGMVWIPGGEFTMGTDSNLGRPDEKPPHRVRVDGFWMDETDVTNAQFRAFVEATSYVTTAEKQPVAEELERQLRPGEQLDKSKLVPGSMVFVPTAGPVPLVGRDVHRRWWRWTPGANWRHPEGPDSDIAAKDNHPVVQVSWDDAAAYATWAGKRLPTEAEWEFAARGGLDGKTYVWGDEPFNRDAPQAKIWQGNFPYRNTAPDGLKRTAPVKSYPPNGYGLYDMSGNVWQWCTDWYDFTLYRRRAGQEIAVNPQGPERSRSADHPEQQERVQRGGSFLCSDDYCQRYRPSARQGCPADTGMSHVGFRCVKSKPD